MTISTLSRCCGERVAVNNQKVAAVAGGAAAVWLASLMLATPAGWLALIPAVFAGSQNAKQLLRLKVVMSRASSDAGGYFRCSRCGEPVGVGEVFGS